MRTFGVGLLLLSPVLVGCSLFRDKRGDVAKADGARPFTGAPAATFPERAERPAVAVTQADYSGLLAGYVRDGFNRPVSNGFIQVVDLSDPNATTKLDISLLQDGEFVIPRLTPGHNYRLIARVKDGTRTLAGTVQATPPKPNLAIRVSEDFVGPDTPPMPGPLGLPAKPADSAEKETKLPPAAGLGLPIRPRTDTTAPTDRGTIIQPPVVVPGGPVDRSNIALDGGFHRVKPDVPVDIPGPKPGDNVPPPPPRIPPAPREEERAPMTPKADADPMGTRDAGQGTPTPVPSCVLIGKKLENFALYGLDGKPWEFRKDRKGQLVLLHFWSSTSGESLAGLKDLRELHASYESFGLQVIGIAYEEGAFAQQVQNVFSARGRYTIKYVTLLGGGGQGPCPVRDQFVVDRLPELVLLGEDGREIWRSRGAPDVERMVELRLLIKRRLRINEP